MSHLTLHGVSADGKRLVLLDADGVEHGLDITPRLRTALRDTASGGPGSRRSETSMDSILRPRDIQTRIRFGESAEAVAAAAQTTVEAIMAFAGPVLAERAHIADRAQQSTLRRRPADAAQPAPAAAVPGGVPGAASSARLLGDAVSAHLGAVGVEPASVEWDAWRRADGRWSLVAGFAAGARAGIAEFTYDARGNFVVLDNEDARWLVGDQPATSSPATGPGGTTSTAEGSRVRRLSAVPSQEAPLGDDAIELVTDPPVPDATGHGSDAPATDPDRPAEARAARIDADAEVETAAPVDPPSAPEAPPARRAVQKKKGRASVPSWDEIMFGGGDQ